MGRENRRRGQGTAEAFELVGDRQPQTVEQHVLMSVGTCDASHRQLRASMAILTGFQDHVGGADGFEFIDQYARGVAEAAEFHPAGQCFPQGISQEADQDVCLDAVRAVMPDGADRQFVLGDAERPFTIGQTPKR